MISRLRGQIIHNLRIAPRVHAGRSAWKSKISNLKIDFVRFPEESEDRLRGVARCVHVARNVSE